MGVGSAVLIGATLQDPDHRAFEAAATYAIERKSLEPHGLRIAAGLEKDREIVASKPRLSEIGAFMREFA